MFEQLKLRRLAKKLEKCKVTPLSRPVLRNQKIMLPDGTIMRALEYIDHVASQLPEIKVNGAPIDTTKRMKEIYYKNNLKGLNLYVSYMKLRLKVEIMNKKPAS